MRKRVAYRAARGRDCKADLSGIHGRSAPRKDWEKSGGRRNSDSGEKGEVEDENIEENIAEREIYRRCLVAETYTVDFLSRKRVKNNGIIPQYYLKNSREPIILCDLYMQVQEEMVRRANLHSGAKRKKRVYSSKYTLLSIVYCSKCGDIYCRIA